MEQGMENLILKLATIQKGENSIPKKTIKILFEKLEDEKFQQIFIKWKKSFSEIHGIFDTQRKVDFDELENLYHLSINTDDTNYGLFKVIFSLETYYSIILRCIGFKAVANEKLDNSNIISVLEGGYFEKINIFNYRCDEIYDWFLNLNEIDMLLKPIIDVFNSTSIDFYDVDLLKHINENIFPSKIRHSMGEFYTPDWLVNFVNDNIINDDEPYNKKFLDPTCGSASFLINIIQKYKSKNQNIINNIFGVDLNPISVLAAKTNVLLASKTEIQKLNTFYVLPIYHQDIIQNFLQGYCCPYLFNIFLHHLK